MYIFKKYINYKNFKWNLLFIILVHTSKRIFFCKIKKIMLFNFNYKKKKIRFTRNNIEITYENNI